MPRAVETITVHFFVFFEKNEEKRPSARHFGGTACGIAQEGPARRCFRAVISLKVVSPTRVALQERHVGLVRKPKTRGKRTEPQPCTGTQKAQLRG